MSDQDPPLESALEHFKRSWLHFENIVRMYLDRAGDDMQRRLTIAVRTVVWEFLEGILLLVGIVIIATGVAALLEEAIGVAGTGSIIIGFVLVAAAVAAIIVRWQRGRRER